MTSGTDIAELRINTYKQGSQEDLYVTTLSDGGFVVTWESRDQDGSDNGIYGQRYDAQGSEFGINTYTASNQENPSVTGLSDGGFVVTWTSDDQDGSGYGVYGRRFPPGTVIRRGTDGDDTIKGA